MEFLRPPSVDEAPTADSPQAPTGSLTPMRRVMKRGSCFMSCLIFWASSFPTSISSVLLPLGPA